jgi:glycosyltransferase involved in cell wall biosynthesis
MTSKKFELVVPAYNEAKNLPLIVERVLQAASKFSMTSEDFNLILVENGSLDNSKFVLKEMLSSNPEYINWIKVVTVEKNNGYGFGIMSGLRSATAKVVGWTHADMQCDPYNAFVAYKILEGHGFKNYLIKGQRVGRNWKDKIVSHVFALFSQIILSIKDIELNAQPKVFNSELLLELKNPPTSFALDLYLIYHARKKKYQIMSFDVYFPPRIHGISNWASNFFGRYKTIFGMILYMFKLAKSEGRL